MANQARISNSTTRISIPTSFSVRSIIAVAALFVAFIAAITFIFTWGRVDWENSFKTIWAIWAALIVYCCARWREQIVTIFFLLAFFLFLLGRPFVRILQGKKWWIGGVPAVDFSLWILFLALFSLGVGAILFALFTRQPRSETISRFAFIRNRFVSGNRVEWLEKYRDANLNLHALAAVSLTIFIICWLASAYLGYEKLSFIVDKSYTDYFLYFKESAPLPVRTLATFTDYALCIYLLTMPRKRHAYVALSSNILLNIPTLLVGLRGRFMFSVLFATLYFFLRARHYSKDTWIGRFEKRGLIFGIPVAIVILNSINYIRSQQVNLTANFLESIVDFFDKQGVSFEVLSHGYYAAQKAASFENNYTFGPFIDFLTRDSYGRLLSGLPSLPGNNSQTMATESHSFAHALSFFQHQNYLGGEGYGSSYLLELFVDYSWLGVICGSLILGVVLAAMPRMFDRGGISGLVALCSLESIFWIPRDSALGWLTFIVSIQFWLLVAIVYLLAEVLSSRRPYLTSSLKYSTRGEKLSTSPQNNPKPHPLNLALLSSKPLELLAAKKPQGDLYA